MKKIEIIIWVIWLILVVLWNYGYPSASPFLDVLIAVLLSIANIIIIKILKKNNF
jgi:hypothetical protein|tara:strand:- start:1034 stop:1198 length:165 start_codon:yes stop_codon:yes gene_type:complete